MTGRNGTGAARATLDRRTLIAGAAALVGVAAGAAPSPASARMPTPAEVFDDPDIPVLGNPEGDVTVVEYFDYQCPFCKKTHPVLEEAVRADGRVRLVMKDWPIFGEVSVEASRMVLAAAGTPDYAKALGALVATPGRLQFVEVDAALRGAGLDPETMAAAYRGRSGHVDAILARNAGQADGFGLSGTPAFVIGTRVYCGALDAAGFAQAIAEARAPETGKR